MKLDSLTWHVMDSMADDWESIEQIRPHVFQFCGATSDEQIFHILRQLHKNGFVEIMEVGERTNKIFPTNPETAWFGMTNAGRAFWDAEGIKYCD